MVLKADDMIISSRGGAGGGVEGMAKYDTRPWLFKRWIALSTEARTFIFSCHPAFHLGYFGVASIFIAFDWLKNHTAIRSKNKTT